MTKACACSQQGATAICLRVTRTRPDDCPHRLECCDGSKSARPQARMREAMRQILALLLAAATAPHRASLVCGAAFSGSCRQCPGWGYAGAQSRAAAFRERPRHRRHGLRHHRDVVDVVFRRLAESTDDGDHRQSRRSLRQPQATLHRESGGVSVGSTVIVAANAQRNHYHLGATLCS